METTWLLTSTFYGNWLPGDPRGFVSSVRDVRPDETARTHREEHDVPGTPFDEDFPGLHRTARDLLKCPPILLDLEQAKVLLAQFQETARFRRHRLLAVAILNNHVHLIVTAASTVDPTKLLGDFKAYGSRALTQRWGKPASETWWTTCGSKRKLLNARAVDAAITYVLQQQNPLVIWCDPAVTANSQEPPQRAAPR